MSFYRSFAKGFYEATGGCELILIDYLMMTENSAGANLTLAMMLKLRDTGRKNTQIRRMYFSYIDDTKT